MAGGPALSPRSGTVTARSGGCCRCASHAAPQQPRAHGTAPGANVPHTDPSAPQQSSCWHHLQSLAEDVGTVCHNAGTPAKPPRCSRPLLPRSPAGGSPGAALLPALPEGSARCRQPGERGGPRFPRSLPRPRCQAPSGCVPPGGSTGAAHVCQPVPAATRWHQPPSPSSSSATVPGAPVPGAGQGSEAGVWVLPITALPRAGNSAAGPALPQRPGCRGPRGHGAGDPLPTSMSLLCYGPKCLLLPQTCLWPLTQPHPDGVRRDGQSGVKRGCRARWGWQALGGGQRAKGQGVQQVWDGLGGEGNGRG